MSRGLAGVVLAWAALAATPAAAGPPPLVSQLVGGLQLDDKLSRVGGGEVEVNVAALGVGIGAGLVVEADPGVTAGLRLLIQLRPMGIFGADEWRLPRAARYFDPFLQLSGLGGGGHHLRAFLALDYGVDFGLWPSRWHPVLGVRAREFLGQTPHRGAPIVLFTFGIREFEDPE